MKKIVALLMASAMAASLAACGGNAQSSEAASTAPAESTAAESTSTDGKKYEGVELTMWSMWSAGEVQANAIQAAADAFEAETGAHVNIEWKGRDVNTLISAALESGEKLDIFEDDYNRIGPAFVLFFADAFDRRCPQPVLFRCDAVFQFQRVRLDLTAHPLTFVRFIVVANQLHIAFLLFLNIAADGEIRICSGFVT